MVAVSCKLTSAVARAHNATNHTIQVQPLNGHACTLAMTSRHRGAKPSLPTITVPTHAPPVSAKKNNFRTPFIIKHSVYKCLLSEHSPLEESFKDSGDSHFIYAEQRFWVGWWVMTYCNEFLLSNSFKLKRKRWLKCVRESW